MSLRSNFHERAFYILIIKYLHHTLASKSYVNGIDIIMMFKNFNQSIICLSKEINNYLCTKSDELKLRTKKTNIVDGVLFKLLALQQNSSYDKACIKLNRFNNNDVSTISYYNRANNLSLNFYKELFEFISSKIDAFFYKNNTQRVILAVSF